MGDMGDYWRDVSPVLKSESQRRRANNRQSSPHMLKAAGFDFEVKNNGAHLIVSGPAGVADFWPGTGRFIFRQGGPQGRGVRRLIKQMRKEA